MANILSISGTHVKHVLKKNGNTIREIGAVSNYTRVSCDQYVRQPYFIQRSTIGLPTILEEEMDGLRLITTDALTNTPVNVARGDVNAPINGWEDSNGFISHGAFAYYGKGEYGTPDIVQKLLLAAFTNGGRINRDYAYVLNMYGQYPDHDYVLNPETGEREYCRTADPWLCLLPHEGFTLYDLAVIDYQSAFASFYHVTLKREREFVFHREIYPPLPPPYGYGGNDPCSTYDVIGDAAPTFFYREGNAYKPFLRGKRDTTVLYQPTVDDYQGHTVQLPRNDVSDPSHPSPMPMMYSYTHEPVKTTAIAANLAFTPDVSSQYSGYLYAPMWFQWYGAAPLKMTPDVIFTDARNGIYPTKGKVVRVEPSAGCAVPFTFSGHPATSMLIPLRMVWDEEGDKNDPPSDFLMTYPYTEGGQVKPYDGTPSHFPQLRFECEFTEAVVPTHVEVIPAANADRDGAAWKAESQKLTVFPSLKWTYGEREGSSDAHLTQELTPDEFLAQALVSGYSSESGSTYPGTSLYNDISAPVMPEYVLIEGKLKPEERWEVLDVIKLPYSYVTLPYPLYRLLYKRKIKYIRFTIQSLYMSLATSVDLYHGSDRMYTHTLPKHPNPHYTHLYFPKMDFFTNPGG